MAFLKKDYHKRTLELIEIKNNFKLLEYLLSNSKSERTFAKLGTLFSNNDKKVESIMIEFHDLEIEIESWLSRVLRF